MTWCLWEAQLVQHGRGLLGTDWLTVQQHVAKCARQHWKSHTRTQAGTHRV